MIISIYIGSQFYTYEYGRYEVNDGNMYIYNKDDQLMAWFNLEKVDGYDIREKE